MFDATDSFSEVYLCALSLYIELLPISFINRSSKNFSFVAYVRISLYEPESSSSAIIVDRSTSKAKFLHSICQMANLRCSSGGFNL